MKKITKNLLVTTALTIAAIHGFNKYIEYTATAKKITKSKYDKYYKWNDISICYNVRGNGRPLLLIHDLSADTSSYEWNRLVDRLSESHKTYVIDLPGCGKSDKPKSEYVLYYFVKLINDFIKDIIKEKTSVITSGSSFGIAVMSDITGRDIKKIIAINPPSVSEYYKIPEKNSRLKKFIMETPVIGYTIYNFRNSYLQTKRKVEKKYYSNPKNVSALTLDYFYEAAHLSNGNGRYLSASIVGRYTNCYILDALKNSITPVAFIYTEKNEKAAEGYKKYTRKIQMHKVEGNQKPHLEYPSVIMESLKVFLPFSDT